MVSLSIYDLLSVDTVYSLSDFVHCLAYWIKILADKILKYFFNFSQKIEYDISCKLSPKETICMKYKIIFSGKNKNHTINVLSAEFAQSMLSLILL